MTLVVEEGESLGLMIRGGREFDLGIYVTGVDPYSVAEHCGLKVSTIEGFHRHDVIMCLFGLEWQDLTSLWF